MKLIKNPEILFVIVFLFVALPFTGNAQSSDNVENELSTWVSTSFSTKVVKDLTFSVSPEIRLKDNFEWNKFLTDFQLEYHPIKYIEASLGYRFIVNTTSDGQLLQNRFFFDVAAKKKFGRFRTKLQLKYTNESDFKADDQAENYLRYKAQVNYNIRKSKFTPYSSAEAFHKLNSSEIELMRYQLGTSYKLNKHNSIKAGYALDYFLHEYKNTHILKLSYSYKF